MNLPPRSGAADSPMIFLHCLRVYLNTTYRITIDLLTEILQTCRGDLLERLISLIIRHHISRSIESEI